MSREDNLLFW